MSPVHIHPWLRLKAGMVHYYQYQNSCPLCCASDAEHVWKYGIIAIMGRNAAVAQLDFLLFFYRLSFL